MACGEGENRQEKEKVELIKLALKLKGRGLVSMRASHHSPMFIITWEKKLEQCEVPSGGELACFGQEPDPRSSRFGIESRGRVRVAIFTIRQATDVVGRFSVGE